MEGKNAIQLKNVTKRFGKVIANDNINLSVKKGEILSILGENGSGKTTLMNMISGIYFPDEGEIFIDGREVTIRSPKDAFSLGIGMVHQHFKLINVLSAAENIILGMPGSGRLNMEQVEKEIKDLSDRYGFELKPYQKIYDMSVSEKQTVEIIKVLYRGADILILDEPTAVLTPQETEKLFSVLRNMRAAGKSIIIITHKLNEVLELSDRVSVLRKGKYIGTVDTNKATVSSLTEMMVGERVSLNIERNKPENPVEKLEIKNLTCINSDGIKTLNNVSLTANSGEILGIAGIAGSGQKELLEAITGLQDLEGGSIIYKSTEGMDIELLGIKASDIEKSGIKISFVPEDRLGMGLVASMGMTDNMMLRSYNKENRFFVDRKKPRELARSIIEKLSVVTPGTETPVGRLSGGNVQKVLVGREIANNPEILILAYPVRGLDINSSYTIYNLMNEQKKKGVAVICVIEDLDVLIELCDKIVVLNSGEVSGILDARKTNKEEVGLLMTRHRMEELKDA
ncbi:MULTISPECIES: ABC transporter ATP-binding protein [Clostridium]|uniref:ABC transporter ATP-binding protein n=4 Tax=Clostridium TaxID=1485 RepID=A0A6N3GPK2_CLOBU|nr:MULTISPECIES: ABC transporter ATP-binding protein [Clostridium]ALR90712.1 ABC transporter ATP-binding protein [Clostridium butyricum]ALS18948.1 ABC transporter ATP-binding protein [Clostridium butyricum]ANF16135.1 ABC transporter ATP-binding protein [Clostridium butyricum]AOR96047.1 ABC transporter ATP-binding protein [Clostridium butyricum]AXB86913.1 ABC transporter ATP-binding protein [Clostridium butyricum]